MRVKCNAVEHRRRIEALKVEHRHTILFVAFQHEETCVPYALALTGEANYEAIRRTYPRVFAGAAFMTWLLQHHLQEIPQPETGCLVCYFSADGWQHVGIMV